MLLDVDQQLNNLELEELDEVWTKASGAKRWKKSNVKAELPVMDGKVQIQAISKGSAVLVPQDDEKWEESNEEDSDDSMPVIIEPEKQKFDIINVDSDGSEEDVVIVMNADNKTNKKKQKSLK